MLHFFRNERAQTLPIFALLIVVFLGVIGLAIDAGRIYVARAELTRALDSAALAGVLELPDLDAAEGKASAYMQDNEPDATIEFPAQTANQFRVTGRRNVEFIFMKVLGFDNIDITAQAAAGMGIVPSDTVALVDATGSMGDSPPCNSSDNNSGCPIWEAKQAALSFVDLFLGGGSSITKVGYTPFRGCHNPPRTAAQCVLDSQRRDLTTSQSNVNTAINNTTSIGGSGTNVCLGLYKAQEMFNGPNAQTAANVVKSLVIMSDGDNTYNSVSYSGTQGAPPTTCRPASNWTTSDSNVSSSCLGAQSRERSLDTKTKALADAMVAQGIEIYVVAFGVCGTLNNTVKSSSYCANIANNDHDNVADQRLLKCIASSTPGTNDHYYAVPTASDLPAVFQQVASAIAFRLIE
jgi:Flp pilus assembly protein TadG